MLWIIPFQKNLHCLENTIPSCKVILYPHFVYMKFSSFPVGRFALQGAVFGLSAAVTIIIVSIVYATASWGSLPTVNSGSGLTATAWNDLVAHVNQSVKQSSPIITVSGSNVGIGTASPDKLLQINKTDATVYSTTDFDTSYNLLKLSNPDTTIGSAVGMHFIIGTNKEASIQAVSTADGTASLSFGTRGGGVRSEKMRVEGNGRISLHSVTTNSLIGRIQMEDNLFQIGTPG